MCVCVRQFGKRLTKKQTKATLDKVALNGLVRFEKPFNKDSLFLHFDSLENEQAAIQRLTQFNSKYRVFLQKAKNVMDENQQREEHAKRVKLALDHSQQKSITETVTPLGHLPYDEQLKMKESEVKGLIRQQFVQPLLKEWKTRVQLQSMGDFTNHAATTSDQKKKNATVDTSSIETSMDDAEVEKLPDYLREYVLKQRQLKQAQRAAKKEEQQREGEGEAISTATATNVSGESIDANHVCFEWKPIEASPVIDGYRNNCEFTVGVDVNGAPRVGFLQGSFSQGYHTTANPNDCKHISQLSKNVVQIMQQFVEQYIARDLEANGPLLDQESAPENGNVAAAEAVLSTRIDKVRSRFDPYDKPTHTGFFRMIKVRENRQGQVMILSQVNPTGLSTEQIEQYKKDLIQYFLSYDKKSEESKDKPFQIDLVSLWVQLYDGWSNAAPADNPVDKIYGQEFMIEEIFGLKFQISPLSFFQVNTKGAEHLYSIAGDWAQIPGDRKPVLLDVCCGTGTIGMSLAHKVEKVIGLEISESAVADAKKNALLNNITNIDFVCGKAEDTLGPQLVKHISHGTETIAIVDPPRGGLHSKVLRALLKCKAIDRLVYISCNPKTLAENAVLLCKPPSNATDRSTPFKPVKGVAVDMFPHTNHCEMIMLFERSKE